MSYLIIGASSGLGRDLSYSFAEKKNDFGEHFIQLARDVYKENDERSKVKSQINKILNSNVQEVKSHY